MWTFFFLHQLIIYFGCSKEQLFHWDHSLKYPQYMLWLRNRKFVLKILPYHKLQIHLTTWCVKCWPNHGRPCKHWSDKRYRFTLSVWSDLSIQIFTVCMESQGLTESQVSHQKILTKDHIIYSQNAVIIGKEALCMYAADESLEYIDVCFLRNSAGSFRCVLRNGNTACHHQISLMEPVVSIGKQVVRSLLSISHK